jgi:acyl-CoA dehydrogenase
MFSDNINSALLEREPRFRDITCSLRSVHKLPGAVLKETQELVALARRFNDEVVRPRALELDRMKHEDPDYLPWDIVEEANRWGFYSMFIPKLFGGRGMNMPGLSYVLEEIASGCTAISNLIGVHYLGVGTLCGSWNISVMKGKGRESPASSRSPSPSRVRVPTSRRLTSSAGQR